MLVPSLMTLGIASAATFVSINSREEIVKVAMACVAIVSLLLTLTLAPWAIKLLLVAIPFGWDKLNYWLQ